MICCVTTDSGPFSDGKSLTDEDTVNISAVCKVFISTFRKERISVLLCRPLYLSHSRRLLVTSLFVECDVWATMQKSETETLSVLKAWVKLFLVKTVLLAAFLQHTTVH